MAGARQSISITVDDAALRTRLALLIRQLDAPREALAEVGEALLNSTRERFSAETSPDGARWARNTEVTLERKHPQTKPLAGRTGLLRDTLRYRLTDGGRAVEIGSDRVYAAVQQFGNPANRMFGRASAPIPARPFLGLSAADKSDVLRIFNEALLG